MLKNCYKLYLRIVLLLIFQPVDGDNGFCPQFPESCDFHQNKAISQLTVKVQRSETETF